MKSFKLLFHAIYPSIFGKIVKVSDVIQVRSKKVGQSDEGMDVLHVLRQAIESISREGTSTYVLR